MGVNQTFLGLSISRLLGNSPFFVGEHRDSNSFVKSYFSHSYNPLFFMKSFSKLKLLKSTFTKLNAPIAVSLQDTLESFYSIEISETLKQEVVVDDTETGLFVTECRATDITISKYSGLFVSKLPLVLINASTFSNINGQNATGIVYMEGAVVLHMNFTTVTNCMGLNSSVGYVVDTPTTIYKCTFTNCSLNSSATAEAPIYFYFKNSELTIHSVYFNNSVSSDQTHVYISIDQGLHTALTNVEFRGNNGTKPAISYSKSSHASLFAIAFVDFKQNLLKLSNSAVAVRRSCSSQQLQLISDSPDSIVTVKNFTTREECDYANIVEPTSDGEETLTKQEKIAQWVTFGFFIVFFVAVFSTLIGLIFCKVGLSEELVFEESLDMEEDSFQSFAA